MDFSTQALIDSTIHFGNISAVVSAAYVGALLGLLWLCIVRVVIHGRR